MHVLNSHSARCSFPKVLRKLFGGSFLISKDWMFITKVPLPRQQVFAKFCRLFSERNLPPIINLLGNRVIVANPRWNQSLSKSLFNKIWKFLPPPARFQFNNRRLRRAGDTELRTANLAERQSRPQREPDRPSQAQPIDPQAKCAFSLQRARPPYCRRHAASRCGICA
jgi:hypothetical protein